MSRQRSNERRWEERERLRNGRGRVPVSLVGEVRAPAPRVERFHTGGYVYGFDTETADALAALVQFYSPLGDAHSGRIIDPEPRDRPILDEDGRVLADPSLEKVTQRIEQLSRYLETLNEEIRQIEIPLQFGDRLDQTEYFETVWGDRASLFRATERASKDLKRLQDLKKTAETGTIEAAGS